MELLSDKEITILEQKLEISSIDKALYHDLLDHLCCKVEEYLQQGLTSEAAIRQAWIELAPEGVEEISFEVSKAVRESKGKVLPLSMYISSFLTIVMALMGLLSYFMKWKFSAFFGFSAILFFTSTWLPAFAIRLRKRSLPPDMAYKSQVIITVLLSVFFGLGCIFLSMDKIGWAKPFISTGLFCLTFLFIPILFYRLYQHVSKES